MGLSYDVTKCAWNIDSKDSQWQEDSVTLEEAFIVRREGDTRTGPVPMWPDTEWLMRNER